MNRIVFTLLFVIGFSSSALAIDPIAPDGLEGFTKVVKPFLRKHCYDCHGDSDGEAGVDLSAFASTINTADQVGGWLKALDQLQADLMPPLDEKRPESAERARVIHWIEKTVLASGHAEAHRRKILLPVYGNYVDHDLLFSGQITAKPYTPARLWRTSPYIFAGKRSVSKRVKGVQNPFTFSTPATGIRDYANTSNVDASVVETIALNAAAEIDYQLAEAEQLVKKPPTKQRRPNLFVPFVRANADVTDQQIARAKQLDPSSTGRRGSHRVR